MVESAASSCALTDEKEKRQIENIMRETLPLLLKYKGALSGEHGDGLIRSYLNKGLFGSEIMEVFCQIKSLFDPDNRMNPGKIIPNQGPV
ncbi:MAG: FAD-linked oxidase C-terminal domain-containing protein, partial [bacterium]